MNTFKYFPNKFGEIQDLKEGQTVEGTVKNITKFGAFVELDGGKVGLVRLEDLAVARTKNPSERIKIGQNVKIVVKSIDISTGKINLSYKEHFGTWKENADNFKERTNVHGIIRETEKNKNGIFIELAPNLVGMAEYQDGLNYGEEVNVFIKKIDYDKQKVKLVILK